jgi:hypothetical protein
MRWMDRVEVEISASVTMCGFSVDFGGQCDLLPDDQNIQERNHIFRLFHGELDRWP